MRLIWTLLCLILLPGYAAGATAAAKQAPKDAKAIFAGGCFWSIQIPFDKTPGVVDTRVGYTGGTIQDPRYEQVITGKTGHVEAVEVTYDPTQVSYEKLLHVYWHNIDPVDPHGQFCDKGPQYRTAIFYGTREEKQKAEDSRMLLEADDERFEGKPIKTLILPRMPFYDAEEHHQRYYKKNPMRYKFYRGRCGHDQRLKQIWGGR